jgi:DNA-binding MarR family transcriptional regulator
MSRVLPKSGGALCDVQGYERPALTAGHRLFHRAGGSMADTDQADDERYFEVLDLLGDLVWIYNGMTRIVRNGRTDYGVIGASGCRVFRFLAEKRGSFTRPVPYRRKELIEDCSLSGGPVDRALKSLSEQGLVTLLRTGTDATAQLHVPPHVFALYQQSKNDSVAGGWGQPPVERHELDAILASLDEVGFEEFAKRLHP